MDFYVGVCGFAVRYERPEELFAYLELDGAEFMLEQIASTDERSSPPRLNLHSDEELTCKSRSPKLTRCMSGSSPREAPSCCRSRSDGIA